MAYDFNTLRRECLRREMVLVARRSSTTPVLLPRRACNAHVADTPTYAVRKITPAGVVTTLAGVPGEYGYTDGTASDARFTYLFGIAGAILIAMPNK